LERGNTVNTKATTTLNTLTIDPARLEQWCAEVRAIRAEIGRPIVGDDDPRLEVIRSYPGHREGYSPEELGDLYFTFVEHEPPELPISLPAWVAVVEVETFGWPDIIVRFWGRNWGGDKFEVRVELVLEVLVDARPPRDHEEPLEGVSTVPGTFLFHPPTVSVLWPEFANLTEDDATVLGAGMIVAAEELSVIAG
jgi:hypothetical protein